MSPKEKASYLVDKYKPFVHGYVGSSMLSNHEWPEVILSQAKKAAMIVVEECQKQEPDYWSKVKNEIEFI